MNLVIAGGGTGGHIFAGIAVADEFLSQSKANKVLFVGASQGLETRLVPKYGYPLHTLALGKLVGQSWLARLKTLFQIPLAIFQCIRVLRSFQAEIVVGVGGYASGPCVVAARILGIPVGILEQNSVMGLTNRLSAKLARFVFLAFERIPQGVSPEKCLVTGNPARSKLKPVSLRGASPFVVFVFGGSQGAHGINKLMVAAAKELKSSNAPVRIVHQTGERDFEWVKKAYAELGMEAEVHSFIDDMQTRYGQATIVICRSGSGTISELAATQSASILIPFPAAAGNHQEANARLLESAGAARVALERELDGPGLARMIRLLLEDPSKVADLREKIALFHRAGAAKQIVETMKIAGMGLVGP